jgi:hypothetical protein
MRSCFPRLLVVVMGAAVLAVLIGHASRLEAADSAKATRKARDLIVKEKDAIAMMAHPTAKLNSVDFDSAKATKQGGYRLEYTFNFTSIWGNDFYSTLAFYFDSDGDFDDEVSIVKTTGLVKPFTAASKLMDLLKDELLKDDEVQKDRELVRSIQRADARRMCELYLGLK